MESHHFFGSSVNGEFPKRRRSLVDIISHGKRLVWNKQDEDAQIEKFKSIVRMKYGVVIDSYWDLHSWSVANMESFWEEILKFFDVIASETHFQVLPQLCDFRGVGWFSGMKFNLAENLLRYRDNHVALICLDETGNEKVITYAEMFEEVKLYAAAFREHGLKCGDIVAGYISNREEALFAMLACASIGALWGGPVDLYGYKATKTILQSINPKFLFVVDQTQEDSVVRNVLENLPSAVNCIASIEKVIIVPTKKETLDVDISSIKNSCFLKDFLEVGRRYPDGIVPELIFEQLPFDHPLSINFTSGTTGLAKGVVHSAGILVGMLNYFGLLHNCTRNDVILNYISSGCIIWNVFASTLALGSTLVLYDGSPFFLSPTYYWEVLAKHRVSIAFIATSVADKMEKMNIVPGNCCNLEYLKKIIMGGSPVKLNNFDFFLKKVKKELLVGCIYGCTEIPLVAGFDSNSPIYSGEIQAPILGVDLKILDDAGNSSVGQRGEVAICSPYPCFPLYLVNDDKNKRLKTSYLTKFSGAWCINDEGWIDPETKGIVVIGRRDGEFNTKDERFTSNDIYFALEDFEEIVDSICVLQKSSEGYERAVLFVRLCPSIPFNSKFVGRVQKKIENELTEYHIPEVILKVDEIPYNCSNKKMENLVSKIIETNEIPDVPNIRNPRCLESFKNVPILQNY